MPLSKLGPTVLTAQRMLHAAEMTQLLSGVVPIALHFWQYDMRLPTPTPQKRGGREAGPGPP